YSIIPFLSFFVHFVSIAPYQIGTAGELYWFAEYVNFENTNANAVLTADITVNSNLLGSLTFGSDGNVSNGESFTSWTPIGGSYSNMR
ncbi:MAG: hypothetical protein ACI4J3_06550, partial [Oscillospiraceae bacterium]